MTAGSKIDYEALAQDALRGVVRNVLTEVARTGLPGDHHFYVSFDTQFAGVTLSKRLREKYPEEMTIVLQHRFWDLVVLEDRFEVKLTFDGIPERLVIPFAAIRVFFDPSVRYGLQFDDPSYGPEAGTEPSDPSRPMVVADANRQGGARLTRTAGDRRPRPARKPKTDKPDGASETSPATASLGSPAAVPATEKGTAEKGSGDKVAPVLKPLAASAGDEAKKPDAKSDSKSEVKQDGKPEEAKIVSLDAFRKK